MIVCILFAVTVLLALCTLFGHFSPVPLRAHELSKFSKSRPLAIPRSSLRRAFQSVTIASAAFTGLLLAAPVQADTLTLTASATSLTVNQSVTFTATYAGSNTSIYCVQGMYYLNGSSTPSSESNYGSNTYTTWTTSFATAGTYTVQAGTNADSPLLYSNTITITVAAAAPITTTTSLTASPNPSTYGSSVTLTATVSPAPAPASVVYFYNGSSNIGQGTTSTGGVATLSTTTLPVGTDSLTAAFQASSPYLASTSTAVAETVNAAPADTLTLTSTATSLTVNQSVTFTATYAGSNTSIYCDQIMYFLNGSSTPSSESNYGSNKYTTWATSFPTAGTYTIQADTNADSPLLYSNTITVMVGKNVTTTTLTASPNPSTVGGSVLLTATVSGMSYETVTFYANGTGSGNVIGSPVTANGSGVATISTSSLPQGTNSLVAVFGGDTNDSASTSNTVSEVVNAVTPTTTTTTTLAASPNPSSYGSPVTFTATLTPSGINSGTVTFMSGSSTIGTGTVSGSTATCTVSTLPLGSSSITAVYGANGIYVGSTSSAVAEVVTTAATTTTLAASPNPSTYYSLVTLTATLTPPGINTGTVTFMNGSSTLGTGSVSGSTATYSTSTLPIGSNSITAVYGANGNYAGSTSSAVNEVVNLGVPSGLTAAPAISQISLLWSTVSGAATYNVYRGTTSNGESSTPLVTGLTAGSYVDTSGTVGTTYYYEVTAVNGSAASGKSNEASAAPYPPIPAAPTGLTATAGSVKISLLWNTVLGAATYIVYRGTASNGESSTPVATGLTVPAYVDTTVTAGTKYYYEVAAVNLGGISSNSNEASATPLPFVPVLTSITVSPTGSVITPGSTQQFTAVANDQLGNPLATQPTFTWSIASGVGSIAQTGLYSAGSTAGAATVQATSGSISGTASLTVAASTSAGSLTNISLSSSTIIGAMTNGTQATCTVTISPAAGAGGAVVSLASNNTSVVTLPSSVTIPAGSTSNAFVITASNVTSQTSVIISAISASNTLTQPITVNPWLQKVTFPPANIVGGNNVTGTITLNAPAPSGGLPVSVTTNNSGVTVAGGSAVTVPAGSLTGTFTLNTTAVTANTNVTVSTTYSGLTLNNNITIYPLLQQLSINPSTVTGGTSTTGTIYLNGPAPTGGISVNLTSSSAYSQVPAAVNIAANATSQTFPITTTLVTSVTSSTIAASYGGLTLSQPLTLNPMTVSLSIPQTVVGGTPVSGTLTLSGTAPTGGVTVSLTSSNTSCATVPVSVTIPAGSSSAPFTITTTVVTSSVYCQIQAAYGGLSSSAGITVTPLLKSVSLSPTSLVGSGSVTGTVYLYAAAPSGGTVVTLSSSSSSASVPASVTVAAGSTQQTFTVTATPVTTYTSAVITASNAGASCTASLYLSPLLWYVSISPSPVYGGGTATGTVYLNAAAPAGGAVVTLSSSNTAVATTPASVTVASGNTSATFNITTLAVASSTSVTIQAAYAGATASQTLTVVPLLSSVSVYPSPALGGSTPTGTVYLSGPAPAGGVTIALSSSAVSVATVPATVTVTAGAQSATFAVAAQPVTVSSSATISATYAGVTKTTPLSVVPLLSNISLNPSTIVGGDPSTGTISFTTQTTSAVTITLSSTSANAIVLASVSVPSGSYSATFAIASTAVSAATTSTVSATYAGVTVTSTLTIDPMPTLTYVSAAQPNSVSGGSSWYGTVGLSGIAPAAGCAVSLSSSNTGALTVPSTVTVSSGQTKANFTIQTTPVVNTTNVTITGTYAGVSQTDVFMVNRPVFNGFTFAQSPVAGGNTDLATLTISSPAPSVGVTISLTCVIQGATGTAATFPATAFIPAGATSVVVPVLMSTVNAPITLLFTATDSVSGGEVLTASVTVIDATLHAVNIQMPQGIVLNWGVNAVGNFLLYRGSTLIATLPNTVNCYTDAFNWMSGQTVTYSIYDGNTTPATLLSTEQCIPVLSSATQDQAVDSRLDPRYAIAIYQDIQFGSTCYNGGLFVGFNSDPSRVGRSFAEFTLGKAPTNGVYRVGNVNAYLVTADTDTGAASETIGCQTIPNNTWTSSAMTWDTAPTTTSFSPASAIQTVTEQYDPTAPSQLVPVGAIGQVSLSWSAPKSSKIITSYTVSYVTTSGSYYSNQITGITGTSTTITGLTNGTAYNFTVTAYYTDGTSSSASQVASDVPPDAIGTGTPPGIWCAWPLSNDIYSIAEGGGGPYAVAWASMNEAQQGWFYFAKSEYGGSNGPAVSEIWSLPTLLSLQVPAAVSSAGSSATGMLTVNAIGLQGSAIVQLTSSNPAVAAVPATATVTGLNRTFTINLTKQTTTSTVTITASMGGVQISQPITVTP